MYVHHNAMLAQDDIMLEYDHGMLEHESIMPSWTMILSGSNLMFECLSVWGWVVSGTRTHAELPDHISSYHTMSHQMHII